ncbi:MAG: alpha/beta fold hydrolase [Elusimicrobiaceae bacterium]|nr:alpha/beta fold hydrolase [Elusimicrobiaceae bacterium]
MTKTFSYMFLTAWLACVPACAQQNPAAAQDYASRPVTFKTADGWTLSAVYRPPQPDRQVLLFLHSHKEDNSIWRPLALKTEAMGFGTLLLDFRGHGGSTLGPGGETVNYPSFDRDVSGPENEYNKMTEDVNAALKFLRDEGFGPDRVILVGAGLGANIAIKSAAEHSDIAMTALFTPTLNANRGVLAVNPLRSYGARPVFVAASVENSRLYQEVSVLRAILYHSAGGRNVTFVTARKGSSAELITPDVINSFLLWLRQPCMPEPVQYRPPGYDDDQPSIDSGEDEPVPDDSAGTDQNGVPVDDDGLGDEVTSTPE